MLLKEMFALIPATVTPHQNKYHHQGMKSSTVPLDVDLTSIMICDVDVIKSAFLNLITILERIRLFPDVPTHSMNVEPDGVVTRSQNKRRRLNQTTASPVSRNIFTHYVTMDRLLIERMRAYVHDIYSINELIMLISPLWYVVRPLQLLSFNSVRIH